jgi:hypothetical protein
VSPGQCGCGASDTDTDNDGTLGCHDPATPQALRAFAQDALAAAKKLNARVTDRDTLVARLRMFSGYLAAAENNAGFSSKQRRLLGGAAKALTDLADAPRRSLARKRAKAVRLLQRLLSTTLR